MGWTELGGHIQSTGSEVFSQAELIPSSVPDHRTSKAMSVLLPPSPQSLRTKCQAAVSLGVCPNLGKPKGLGGLGGSGGGGMGKLIMNTGQTAAQPGPKGPVG